MSTSVPPPGYVPPATYASPPSEPPPPVPRARGPRTRRPLLLAGTLGAAILAAVVFLLFGSGGSPLSNEIARAAAISGQTPGYRMNMGIQMSVPGVATPITASGDGVLDLRDRAASMSLAFDFSQIPQAAQALGSTTMRMGMIMDGPTVYVRFPSVLAAKIPGLEGKPWVRVDLAKLSGIPGLSSLTSNPTMSDPSQMLRYLRAASDGVRNDGREVVDGVATTHYHAELSLDSLANNVPPAERAAVQQAMTRLEQATRVSDLPVDVWIDDHHLVRRLVMSMGVSVANSQAIHETVTADFFDYGPQSRPAAPPADQVQDVSSLMGGARDLGTVTGP